MSSTAASTLKPMSFGKNGSVRWTGKADGFYTYLIYIPYYIYSNKEEQY